MSPHPPADVCHENGVQQKATCILMDLLLGSEVTVSSQLDVTSQQHLFLLGQNGAHFLSVMHQTQTQIILPDLNAPQSPPSLLIQGSPDGVCLARQQLMVHFCSGRHGTVLGAERSLLFLKIDSS